MYTLENGTILWQYIFLFLIRFRACHVVESGNNVQHINNKNSDAK